MKLLCFKNLKYAVSSLPFLVFCWGQYSVAEEIILATVEFSEIAQNDKQKVKQGVVEKGETKTVKKSNNQYNKRIKRKGNWYEINGYLNRKYVYLVVKKTGNNHIEGYLYDGHGNKKYVYGEWFRQQLQVYDQSNQRFTVILNE